MQTINKVHRQINPKLQIDGILLTMVDSRTNFAKDISALLRDTYGGKVAEGYANLTKEVLKIEKQREKCKAGIGR